MLRSMKLMNGFSVAGSDGDVGNVKDIFFDDERWTARYLVVDTGGWLMGRKVLVSPHSVEQVDWTTHRVHVRLTKDQVESSPDIDTAKPVSRQHEASLFDYYGYPYYWTGPFTWGTAAYPMLTVPPPAADPSLQSRYQRAYREVEQGDPHLRSADVVTGYDIEARDGKIGHVEDFMFDDMDWSIAVMVVDTRNWWPGKHVLLSLDLVDRVSWEDNTVFVDTDRAFIEQSPELDENRIGRQRMEIEAMRHAGSVSNGPPPHPRKS